MLGRLVGDDIALLEPQSNLLLGVLDAVGAVADVAASDNGKVAADGAGLRGQGVGGTEQDTAGLDGVKALPDHGDNGAAQHVGDEAGEEGLVLEVGVWGEVKVSGCSFLAEVRLGSSRHTVGLEVLLGGGDQLDSGQLVAVRGLVSMRSSRSGLLTMNAWRTVNIPTLLEALDDGADQAALEKEKNC